jgi:protein TIF31
MYLSLSNIYFSLDEKTTAADLARKAVIIAERTMGLDASETVLAYLNLGLFEHAAGRSAVALQYVLHALVLTRAVFGPGHPDVLTILNNGAVMLQALRRYAESRAWFERSLALSDTLSGRQSVASATLLFQLAQAQALDRDHHAAVNTMRESSNLFRTLLGPDDRNTKEAQTWLDSLTSNAVSAAKREKDIASGKVRRVQFLPGHTSALMRSGASAAGGKENSAVTMAGKAAAAAVNAGGKMKVGEVDRRNIDDLIRYIDGGDAKKKKTATTATSAGNNGRKKSLKRR